MKLGTQKERGNGNGMGNGGLWKRQLKGNGKGN